MDETEPKIGLLIKLELGGPSSLLGANVGAQMTLRAVWPCKVRPRACFVAAGVDDDIDVSIGVQSIQLGANELLPRRFVVPLRALDGALAHSSLGNLQQLAGNHVVIMLVRTISVREPTPISACVIAVVL